MALLGRAAPPGVVPKYALLLAVFDQWRLDERRLLARLRYGNSLEAATARPWRASVTRAFRAVATSQTPGRMAVAKRFMALSPTGQLILAEERLAAAKTPQYRPGTRPRSPVLAALPRDGLIVG